ncbi:hypothetical protein JTE90_001496 [Oedothorax gibbosus]|uniref:Activin types I and II receptor domain-containing protein n=1 Tax=Oedothorax gibbosus TaxID=931172 RepID=A0AAV6UKQ1_9ARAC|nr:hypothetical protein JTE90_001496 [Oedothorax gibbosus]
MFQCLCNTTPCIEEGTTTCNTTALCFSQYLDRGDGSEKLLRGCMASRTPLLCENRRPAVGRHHKWPVLVCCSKNMCNDRVFPTLPPTTSTTTMVPIATMPPAIADLPSSNENSPRAMNVIYLLMVAIGVCCIGVGTAIAVFLSRRHSTFCDPEFGTVGPNGYVKGCCSESAIPKSRIIANKITMGT